MPKHKSKPGPKPSGKWDKNRHRVKESMTDEMKRQRMLLVGPARLVDGKMVAPNPELSEYPLGALWARGEIEEREHLAGQIYAGLRASHNQLNGISGLVHPSVMAWRRLVPQAIDADTLPEEPRVQRDETEEERFDRIISAFGRWDLVLRRCGPSIRQAVKDVACYQRWDCNVSAVKAGLKALADAFRIKSGTREKRAA